MTEIHGAGGGEDGSSLFPVPRDDGCMRITAAAEKGKKKEKT